jgi:hypothetical protein
MSFNKKSKRCCGKKHCKHGKSGKSTKYSSSESESFSSSSGSDFSQSSESSFDASSEQSDFSNSSYEETPSKSMKSSRAAANKEKAAHLTKTADIKFSSVEYEAHRAIKPIEFFSRKTGELKNKGSITLSVEKGHFERIRGTNTLDFQNIRPDQKGGNHDLIKSIKLTMVSNYPQTMVVSFPTISAIEGEFFRDGKNYVNHTIPAGTFSSSNSRYEKVILNRDITNSSKEYANYYSGYNPDNMDSGIYHLKNHIVLSLNNPALMVFNTKYPKLAVTEPNVKEFHSSNDVMIDKTKGLECLKIAKEKIGNKVSLGNCNDKFKVIISAVMPYERKASHEKGKDTFQGFGDVKHIIASSPNLSGLSTHPETKLPLAEHFQQQPLIFDVWCEFEYVRLDGKSI